MKPPAELLYCPALRMKTGELNGVLLLAAEIAQHVLPRFIVPPLKERDPAQPQLIMVEDAPDISGTLARHWREREALLDLTHLIDECGRDRIEGWLPKMFKRARSAGGRPVPMALLTDLGDVEARAFAAAIDRTAGLQFALCVPFDEIGDSGCQARITAALGRIKVAPEFCAVIADFSGADVSEPRLMAPVILGSLEALQDVGRWRHVIFQGAHFPDKNPAEPGGSLLVPRNDWNAWMLAIGSDPATARQMMFGDYAADCAKIDFKGSGGKAIPHYRYATKEGCLVERGAKTGSHKENMRGVASRIVNSSRFAGAAFSIADDIIAQTARGGSPGNASTWRQVNTTHHVTFAIREIASLYGIEITERVQEPEGEQLSLLLPR